MSNRNLLAVFCNNTETSRKHTSRNGIKDNLNLFHIMEQILEGVKDLLLANIQVLHDRLDYLVDNAISVLIIFFPNKMFFVKMCKSPKEFLRHLCGLRNFCLPPVLIGIRESEE